MYFNGNRSFPSNFSSHLVKDIALSRFITKAANAVMVWFEDNTRPMTALEEAKVRAMSAARFYELHAVCGANEQDAPTQNKNRGKVRSTKSNEKIGKKSKRKRNSDASSDEF